MSALERRRRDVVRLAARTARARARADVADARFAAARTRFLANPLNLLLPFTAGALSGALALHRKPSGERDADGHVVEGSRREGVSLRSLIGTATTLWTATATLRDALRAGRLDPPSPPPEHPPGPAASSTMPPAAVEAAAKGARHAS